MCIRCYLYYSINPDLLPRGVEYRNYQQVKESDWSPSYRYGHVHYEAKVERIIVNHWRTKLDKHPVSEKKVWTNLRKYFLKTFWKSGRELS